MQRERSALNSFPEPIDLNQENPSMDHSASWNNFVNPVENRLSTYMLGASDGNASCPNEAARSFTGWDRGESSSNANSTQDGGDSKTRLGWSSSEDWSVGPPNIAPTSYPANQANSRSLNLQSHSSNRASLNLNLNHGPSWDSDFHRGPGVGLPHNLYKPGDSEMEQIPIVYGSSSNMGTFSGSSSSSSENRDAQGPSFGTWGSSCKRKALEGSSGQFYPGGSSSFSPHPFPVPYSASGSLSISSDPPSLSTAEQLNFSGGGMSRVAPGPFPSSNSQGVVESSARTYATRSNHGRLESFPFDTIRSTSVRSSAGQLSRANAGPSESRSLTTLPVNQPNTLNQPHLMHPNEVRGTHSYPWNGSFGSRGDSSSTSFMVSGERASGAREDINVRSSRRNNLDYPAPETRNVMQDQVDWSFSPSSSRNHPSGPRVGPTAALLPHQIQSLQNHQRVSEPSPWGPFSRVDSESGTMRSHFSLLPSSTSSLQEEIPSSSRALRQLDQRAAAVLMDVPSDEIDGWHALNAVEGRHRLIRQVLNAMRRGVHLQAEDYMLIDPFINGYAELHDRHRDMRLDVDNMSYEELLALEEQIGNVNTGLSEEKIRVSMKQRKYQATRALPNVEPCCICQENYVTGEDVGTLDCGHEFHTSCIKQWLTLKNICPICKMTALET